MLHQKHFNAHLHTNQYGGGKKQQLIDWCVNQFVISFIKNALVFKKVQMLSYLPHWSCFSCLAVGCSSEVLLGHQEWHSWDLTPHSHWHLEFISPQVYAAARRQKVLDSVWCRDFATFTTVFSFDLPAFHLPPCCSSIFSGLVASRGSLFKLD